MTPLAWPIGRTIVDGIESVCAGCGTDLVVIREQGRRLAFEYARDPAGEDGRDLTWDHSGRPDGWMCLRPHVCDPAPDCEERSR